MKRPLPAPSGGLVKRSITLAGHRTSVALEQEFWDAAGELAARRGITVARLVAEVDDARPPHRPLASALRVAILRSQR